MSGATRRHKGRALTLTLSPCHLVTLSLFLAAGCDLPGRPDPADRPVPADQVKDFDVLFGTRCAGCHGADGKLGPASSKYQHEGEVADKKRQGGPHAHSINLDAGNHFAFVADLGLDQVFVYRFDPDKGTVTKNEPPSVKPAARYTRRGEN